MESLNLSDLNLNQLYLAKRYFNSKKIIWQPVRIISLIPYPNRNGFNVIDVEFIDGQRGTCYVNLNQLSDSFNQVSLKPIGNWIEKEVIKLDKEITYLQSQRDKLLGLISLKE